MYKVTVRALSKHFGTTPVLRDVELEVRQGELFFLLGPSGCGKTTLLRVITGFELPDRGDILFNDTVVTAMPPQKRNTSMVFQNYALWPHLSVAANIAFGLENRRVPASGIKRRVGEALELVRMRGFEDRLPNQLSGGQQQRVALARALVVNPELLLLDEPLSNLDARLRAEMRTDLLRVHRETGVTAIYVTHDQEEALSMADRIAFMDQGRLVQVDTPRRLYRHPADIRTARFLGNANIIEGTVTALRGAMVDVKTPIGTITGIAAADNLSLAHGRKVHCFFRPEDAVPGGGGIDGTVMTVMYAGGREHLFLDNGGTGFQALVALSEPPMVGSRVSFSVSPDRVVVFGG